MKKAIVVLTGVPAGKNKFTEVCKGLSWVWGINPKNHRPKNEECPKEFEEKYLLENIERFKADEASVKTDGINEYDTFLLIAHGVSGKQMEMLKEEYGVYKIHIVATSEEITDEMSSHNDLILAEADEYFAGKVSSIIRIIAKG